MSEVAYAGGRAVTVGDFVAYDRNLGELRRARQRAELEERRTALRRDLARRRARGTAKDNPESVSQIIDEIADLTRRIDEIDGLDGLIRRDQLDQENDGEAE